jgi:hypothetical protein
MNNRLGLRRRKIRPDQEPCNFNWVKDVLYDVRDSFMVDLIKLYENFA